MQSLDLFHQHPDAHEQCHEAIIMRGESAEERARSAIMDIMKAGHICTGAYSSGKDSSALTSIMFLCAVQLKRQGIRPPPIVIMHSQTGVENPEVSRLALAEIEKMKVFAARHDLELHVLVGFPELNDSWPVRVIGGRALPSFATTRVDCSVQCSQALFPQKCVR